MNVLVIGDTHCPAMHPNYLEFLQDIRSKFKCTKIVHIGDVIDHHCVSFHDKHPDSTGAVDEYDKCCDQTYELYRAFPNTTVCIGNHDARVNRLAAKQGIPDLYLKAYNDLYLTKKWKWVHNVTIDDVYYYHGEGVGGMHPAFSAAKMRMQNTVVGHYHSSCGVWYQAGPNGIIWGMNVGCGVDRHHLSMQYGAAFLKKPIIACGVVQDGCPHVEVMNL